MRLAPDIAPHTDTLQFRLTNTGAGSADFTLKEGSGHTNAPQIKFTTANKVRVGKSHRNAAKPNVTRVTPKASTPAENARSIKGLALNTRHRSMPYPKAAGDVIQTWTPSSTSWGIAVDAGSGNVWVDSPSPGWGGDDNIYEYQTDGTATGTSWSHTWGPSNGPADSTFNETTGTIWTLNVVETTVSTKSILHPA